MLTASSICATTLGLVLAFSTGVLIADTRSQIDRLFLGSSAAAAILSTAMGWFLAAGIAS